MYSLSRQRGSIAVTVIGYGHDLRQFYCRVIVGTIKIEHTLSKRVSALGFSQSAVVRVYQECKNS